MKRSNQELRAITRQESDWQFNEVKKRSVATYTEPAATACIEVKDRPEGAGWIVLFGAFGIVIGTVVAGAVVYGTVEAIIWVAVKFHF